MTDTSPAPAADLPTAFAPAEVEGTLYERWVQRGYFEADDKSDRPPYCIVIPPPNVPGSLHLGHAFEPTLIDALIRRRRMQGYEALWMPGMAHAGIATQNVVERELAREGLSRHDLGREAFVQRVWQWKEQSGGQISGQMRRLGDSVAWSRERFTMDEGLSRAVQTIFKRLYDDGLIYRAERIINWCVRCHTALSDIEVEHTEDDGELISIRYDDEVVVATTRAETMLGDTAVAVNPDVTYVLATDGTETLVVAQPLLAKALGEGWTATKAPMRGLVDLWGRSAGDGSPAEVFAREHWPELASTYLEPPLAARTGAALGLGSTPTDHSLIEALAGQRGLRPPRTLLVGPGQQQGRDPQTLKRPHRVGQRARGRHHLPGQAAAPQVP